MNAVLSSLHLVLAAAALVPWAGRQEAGGGGRAEISLVEPRLHSLWCCFVVCTWNVEMGTTTLYLSFSLSFLHSLFLSLSVFHSLSLSLSLTLTHTNTDLEPHAVVVCAVVVVDVLGVDDHEGDADHEAEDQN
jgi:hypothetical protein